MLGHLAALDVIAVLLHFCFSRRSLRQDSVECLYRVGGSLWIGLLRCRGNHCDKFLLRSIGSDPWAVGWHRLWHGASLYVCVRARPGRSKWGPLIYVGESACTIRRSIEHIVRILRPHGVTQQPFFDIVRRNSRDSSVIKRHFCEWLIIPVQSAPCCTSLRK